MFGLNLSSNESFFIGIAALWLFSAAVGALVPPTDQSGAFYKWAYTFLKAIAGDLNTVFGKYMPPAQGPQKLPAFLLAIALGVADLAVFAFLTLHSARHGVLWKFGS